MPEDDVRETTQAQVIVFDTTLRDGEQSPGATLTSDEKLEVADALVELGIDVMEAGFPAASPGDFEAVRAIANRVKGVTVAGLARCNESDIERAAMAVKGAESARIHTFIATSDIHLDHKLRMTRPEVLERVDRMVRFAAAFTSDVEFSAEDATRSDWAFLAQVFAAGMATANTLAAVRAGARQVEVTVNGIGERAGNTSLEEVVMALATRGDQFGGGTTRIRKERLVPASRLVSTLTGVPVQP